MTDLRIARLVSAMGKLVAPSRPEGFEQRRWGVVVAVGTNTLDVAIGGAVVPGLPYYDTGVVPAVGERVVVHSVQGDMIVAGRLAGAVSTSGPRWWAGGDAGVGGAVLVVSDDGAVTWGRQSCPLDGGHINCLADDGNGRVVVVGSGIAYTDNHGLTWTEPSTPFDTIARVVWSTTLGVWIIGGVAGAGSYIKTTTNFVSFTDVPSDFDGETVFHLGEDAGRIVVTGNTGSATVGFYDFSTSWSYWEFLGMATGRVRPNGGYFFVTNGDGDATNTSLFASNNPPSFWDHDNTPFDGYPCKDFSFDGSLSYVVGDRHTQPGASVATAPPDTGWTDKPGGPDSTGAICVASTPAATVVGSNRAGANLCVTANGGTLWTPISTALDSTAVRDILHTA